MAQSTRTTEVAQRKSTQPGAEAMAEHGEPVQVSDQALLDLMRSEDSYGVGELAERLQVTDTAVRQRLTRLMDRGFVQRAAIREGRGRPKHVYCLTEAGVRESGANLEDLAVALWQEIIDLEDSALRERLIVRVVDRLTKRYAVEVSGASPAERMKSVVDLFNRRGIPFSLEEVPGEQPRLKVLGCPYPGLAGSDRYVCLMEQMLFQRLIGSSVESISCDVSASGCCEYVPLTDGKKTSQVSLEVSNAEKDNTANAGKELKQNSSGCSKGNCHCKSGH